MMICQDYRAAQTAADQTVRITCSTFSSVQTNRPYDVQL